MLAKSMKDNNRASKKSFMQLRETMEREQKRQQLGASEALRAQIFARIDWKLVEESFELEQELSFKSEIAQLNELCAECEELTKYLFGERNLQFATQLKWKAMLL